jgi:hypothetical protein
MSLKGSGSKPELILQPFYKTNYLFYPILPKLTKKIPGQNQGAVRLLS